MSIVQKIFKRSSKDIKKAMSRFVTKVLTPRKRKTSSFS